MNRSNTECLIEKLKLEELQKPWWIRSQTYWIVCKCKKCCNIHMP